MFEEAGCPWCRKWHAEVGVGYARSPEGQRAPLRQVDLHGSVPKDLQLASPVVYSPTFVLTAGRREVGRITGYPGADFFWSLLGELLKMADAARPS
jgi:hypothetical protein